MNGYLQPITIIDVVRRHFGLTYEQIVSERRDRELIKAKHIAMYFCRAYTGDSFKRIGLYFSGKKHCTVLFAVHSVETQANIYSAYNHELSAINYKIKNLCDDEFKKYKYYNTDNV